MPYSAIDNAFLKYGKDNFLIEVIQDGISNIDELNAMETYWISEYDSLIENNGYNITTGGKSYIMSESTKLKISKSKMGYSHTEEAKRNMRKNHADVSGKNNPNYGKKMSEENKLKLRNRLLGKKLPPETIQKIANKNRGKKRSKEIRKRMSDNHPLRGVFGKDNPNYGSKRTNETKRKISIANSMPVIVMGEYYSSQKNAAEALGLSQSTISRWVRNELNNSKISELYF